MQNGLSVDVEDWFQVGAFERTIDRADWPSLECRVEANCDAVLQIFADAGAKGTFFARSIDMEVNLTKECLIAAAKHQGMSVTEVLQNCVIFNDKTHAAFAGDKATRQEHTITLRHGEKMLFGANNEKGLVFEDMRLKVVTVGQDGYTLDKILTHDAHTKDTTLHSMLAAMKYPDYPVALGVIRSVEDEIVYDQAVEKQVEEVKAQSKIHCVDDLLHSGATWEI